QTFQPKVKALQGQGKCRGVHHAFSLPSFDQVISKREGGEDATGGTTVVPKIKVVDIPVVKVDRLVDQAQSKECGIEIDVLLSISGCGRAMVIHQYVVVDVYFLD